MLQYYRYSYIDTMLSITSLAYDAGQGSAICNRIYHHTHNYIYAILHIVSTAEIQCTDFCKIEQPNLQNSATIQPETLHLEKADPGGIWNCDNNYRYSAQLLLTAVLIGMGLNRLHGPIRGGNVKLHGDNKNVVAGRCGPHTGIIGACLYRRTCRIPSERAGCREPVGVGLLEAVCGAFPAGSSPHRHGPGNGDSPQAVADREDHRQAERAGYLSLFPLSLAIRSRIACSV